MPLHVALLLLLHLHTVVNTLASKNSQQGNDKDPVRQQLQNADMVRLYCMAEIHAQIAAVRAWPHSSVRSGVRALAQASNSELI